MNSKKSLASMLIAASFFSSSYASAVNTLGKIDSAEHKIVYHQKGFFAGWPANNGAWIFHGQNLLVGFTRGPYELKKNAHNISRPRYSWLASSEDGGHSWRVYDPENYVGDFGEMPILKSLDKPLDFSRPEFILRIVGTAYHGARDPRGHFFYSHNRGQSWRGPFGLNGLVGHPELTQYGLTELTPRTDYIITGKHSALLMISARLQDQFGSDRLFCAETRNGGQSFEFKGWIVPPMHEGLDQSARVNLYANAAANPHPSQARAVMSQSFQLEDSSLLSSVRRRYKDKNWVDLYRSTDGGSHWQFVSKIVDVGGWNGNPPALNIADDGRLVAVFGERSKGMMLTAYSTDMGETWGTPYILRDDFYAEDNELDLGYPRLLKRSDGKMIALYYYSNKSHLHNISATIWQP